VQVLVDDVKRRGREGRLQAAALERSEARMGEATANSPMGIAQAELDGTFLSVNPALCGFLGRPEKALLGRRGREFSHPDDLEQTAVGLARLLRGATSSLQEEKRYLQPDGTEVILLLSMTVVRDADGAPSQLLAHFADLTAQKLAEQALRESEASLQAIARVSRRLSSSSDVRATICEATIEVVGAASAFIFEPDGGELALTASAGAALPPPRLALSGTEASGAVSAYLSGRRIFVENAKTNPAASTRIAHLLDAGSALYEPIVSRGKPSGVLVVVWQRQLTKLVDHAVAAVGLLADEAAVALERDALLTRLSEQALEDELTSLPNRRAWESQLPVELARTAREKSPCSVALLDLDHFKQFNDTHGHQSGDELLSAAALAWRTELRPTDFLARYGGEEFAIFLPGCDIAEATAALNRVAAAVPRGQTCSIGVARWDGTETAQALVERADRCLYQAKALGRARIEAASPRLLPTSLGPFR
jgi:diguanylate cyclase (GGDEF)-like protein/PAS domain S-box-containing protein